MVHAVAGARRPRTDDANLPELDRALRCLHLLMRSARLYERHHPHTLQNLDNAYEGLRAIAVKLNGLELRIERGGIVAPKINETPLPDTRGELHALATDLRKADIHNLAFAREFHVGELDTLAQLMKATLLKSEDRAKASTADAWANLLEEHRVEGISINTQTGRKVDSVLSSLIAAMVAYGGHSPREASDTPIRPPAWKISWMRCVCWRA